MSAVVAFEDFADMLVEETCRPIQEALAAATGRYWMRRAAQFEAARPRPDDYPGRLDAEQLANQDRRISAKVQACRARAAVSDLDTVTPEERQLIEDLVLGEAA